MQKGLIVSAVIFNSEKEVLLLKRASTEDVYPDYWDIPGGTLEDGEDPEKGIQREIFEETGLSIENLSLFGHISNIDITKNKQFVRLEFIAAFSSGEVSLNPAEHQEYKWVKLSELKNYICIPYMYTIPEKLKNHALLVF